MRIEPSQNNENNYFSLNKKTIQNCQLPMMAIGLWTFLLSQDDDYKISPRGLRVDLKTTKWIIEEAFRRLKDARLVTTEEASESEKKENGKPGRCEYKYKVYDSPQEVKPVEKIPPPIKTSFKEPSFSYSPSVQAKIFDIIYRLRLTPYEMTLYKFIQEKADAEGKFSMCLSTISEHLNMAPQTVKNCQISLAKPRTKLNGKSLITLENTCSISSGRIMHTAITLVDLSE